MKSKVEDLEHFRECNFRWKDSSNRSFEEGRKDCERCLAPLASVRPMAWLYDDKAVSFTSQKINNYNNINGVFYEKTNCNDGAGGPGGAVVYVCELFFLIR